MLQGFDRYRHLARLGNLARLALRGLLLSAALLLAQLAVAAAPPSLAVGDLVVTLVSIPLGVTALLAPFGLLELHVQQRSGRGTTPVLGLVAATVATALLVPLIAMQLTYSQTLLETGSVQNALEDALEGDRYINSSTLAFVAFLAPLFLGCALMSRLRLGTLGMRVWLHLLTFPSVTLLVLIYATADGVARLCGLEAVEPVELEPEARGLTAREDVASPRPPEPDAEPPPPPQAPG